MADDDDMFCLWEEWQFSDESPPVLRCNHPLGKPFCNYTWRVSPRLSASLHADQEECPFYKPKHESSWIEEEVRQYLEYTEESK